MKAAIAVVVERDTKPANDQVELVRHPEIDPRRARRIAEILADILNNPANPEQGR